MRFFSNVPDEAEVGLIESARPVHLAVLRAVNASLVTASGGRLRDKVNMECAAEPFARGGCHGEPWKADREAERANLEAWQAGR